MSILEKLKQGPTLSYEFFPPKNAAGWGTLYGTLAETLKQKPEFVSVTYGAGGSTRAKTVDLVERIQGELSIEAMAHLTCVGHSRDELRAILGSLWKAGIRHVLALRGDPPKGVANFQPHPDGFSHATELIQFIKENFEFNIGCAYYPEKHLESKTLEQDVNFLKLKQDCGADFAVSQLFFDNTGFYTFRDKAAAAGVTIPLIAGIMPVSDLAQLPRFRDLSGCTIPDKLVEFLGTGDEVAARGIEFATEQCEDLLRHGIAGIHLYCLNKHQGVSRISENLRARGFLTPQA